MQHKSPKMMYSFKGLVTEKITPLKTDPSHYLPKARSGHRIVCDDDGNVYSFGGYNPAVDPSDPDMLDDEEWQQSHPLFRELLRYSPVTKTWCRLKTSGTPPEHLASHSTVMVGNHKLLVYGGTAVPFGESASNTIYVCDLLTKNWSKIVPKNRGDESLPEKMYGQAITFDPETGSLYVVGGTTGHEYSIDIHKFDFRTKLWSVLFLKENGINQNGSCPQERYKHEIVLYQNKLYVFGGGLSDAVCHMEDIPIFDLETKSWDIQNSYPGDHPTEYPPDRKCHGCVRSRGDPNDPYVYIVGGTDGLTVFNDVWRFDLQTLSWKKLCLFLPEPLFFHGVCISTSGRITVFGGVKNIVVNQTGPDRTNAMYEVFVKIPPLQELAFMAFMSYADENDLAKCTVKGLSRMGIPIEYLRKLRHVNSSPSDDMMMTHALPAAY